MKTYKLKLMDKYPVCVAGTCVEQVPTFEIEFDASINIDKLKDSISKAILRNPYFGCRVSFKKPFYLEEINNEYPIFESDFNARNTIIGKNTNGYPFQFTINDNKMLFEWCHAVSDGVGGYNFIVNVLRAYFDDELEEVKPINDNEPGVEDFKDKNIEALPEKKQQSGFAIKKLKYIDKNRTCACHELEMDASDLIRFGKTSDATPAVILVPLFARALRMSLDKKLKNRNVKTVFVLDLRRRFNVESRHNLIVTKAITYIDAFDKMELSQVCTIYRAILELANNKENLVKAINEKIDELKLLYFLRTTPIINLLFKPLMSIIKNSGDENVNFTYIGRVRLGEKAEEHIRDFRCKCYPDFGQINIAAIDYKGKFNITLSENIVDKDLLPNFLRLSKDEGIPIKEVNKYLFKSSTYEPVV